MFEKLKQVKPKTETLPSVSLLVKNISTSVIKVYFYSQYDLICKVTLEYVSIQAGETRSVKDLCPKSKYQIWKNGTALTRITTVEEQDKRFHVTNDGIFDFDIGEATLAKGRGEISKTSFSFLIKNISESDVIVYFYSRYDLICKVSLHSIIVKPGETKRRDISPKSKYQVWRNGVAVTELTVVQREDIFYEVTENLQSIRYESHSDIVSMTDNNNGVKQQGMAENTRRELVLIENCEQFLRDSKSNGAIDHYSVLGLSMVEVRAMSYDKQTRLIKTKYHELALENHPDHGNSSQRNKHIWNLICEAYKVLKDPEVRVRYHNEFDFNQPYRSKEFWRSLFWPEVYCSLEGVQQPDVARMREMRFKRCRDRVLYFLGSGSSLVGGIVLALLGGAPGAIIGFCMIGAGLTSLQAALQLDCTPSQWLKHAGVGGITGLVTGGVAVGASALIIGSTVVTGASIGQQVAVGSIVSATASGVQSLGSDAIASSEGERMTVLQVSRRALLSAGIGGLIGAAGGAAGAALNSTFMRFLSTTNIDEEVTALLFGRAALRGASSLIQKVIHNGAEFLIYTPAAFIEDRLNHTTENRHPVQYIREGLVHHSTNLLLDAVGTVGASAAEVTQMRNVPSHAEYTRRMQVENGMKGRKSVRPPTKVQSEIMPMMTDNESMHLIDGIEDGLEQGWHPDTI